MTWVIGRAVPFGYAIGLSDIRVTLQDGSEIDCLQKIHDIGPMLALGFAGSVKIGLEFVNQLRMSFHTTEKNIGWNPLKIAESFPQGAKNLFNSFPDKIKEGDCHLMLLSAHPTENIGRTSLPKCYIHKFYAPDFEPIEMAPSEIATIGSGANVEQYIDAIKKLEKDLNVLEMETMTNFGAAYGSTFAITSAINGTRKNGISNHLHICLVNREGIRIGKNNTIVPDHPEENFTMPSTAETWEELVEIMKSKGLTKSSLELAKC